MSLCRACHGAFQLLTEGLYGVGCRYRVHVWHDAMEHPCERDATPARVAQAFCRWQLVVCGYKVGSQKRGVV
jgi:hypothetical protein